MNRLLLISVFSLLINPIFSIPQLKKGMVYRLQAENEFYEILQEENVVVDFYADWCTHCGPMHSVIDAAAREFPNIYFIQVDADAFKTLASKYRVRSLPNFLFFKNGIKVNEKVGSTSKAQFFKLLHSVYN
jgi:thioredoxin 1